MVSSRPRNEGVRLIRRADPPRAKASGSLCERSLSGYMPQAPHLYGTDLVDGARQQPLVDPACLQPPQTPLDVSAERGVQAGG